MMAADTVCCEGMPEYVLHQVWIRDARRNRFLHELRGAHGHGLSGCCARRDRVDAGGRVPPVQGAVQKKAHKRAVIAGMCVAGVLVAGGSALALTGVLGPLGQGNSSQITVLGSDEGSAEHKDKGSAKEKPAEEQEEPEEPGQTGSSVKVDLNDQATYAAANLFLSNFTEEHFDRDWYQTGGFDSTDGLSDDEKYKLVKFIWCHFIDNAPYRIEKGDYDNGNSQRVATDVINR